MHFRMWDHTAKKKKKHLQQIRPQDSKTVDLTQNRKAQGILAP